MRQLLVIPDREELEVFVSMARKYGVGFEYNDFWNPQVLDNEEKVQTVIAGYREKKLPGFCTLHGAFLDVIPFSPDERIKKVATLRIGQSIKAAKALDAGTVVFHTGYNPFLNSEAYVNQWIETNVTYWSGVLEQNSHTLICLENTFETTPVIMERLSEQLGKYDNYGVCFDYAHACLSGTAPEEWAKRLGRFVKHVHINDNDGVSDIHLAWGDGKLDRERFYRCYEESMEGATVLVETTGWDKTEKSLHVLKKEGFI